MRFAGIVTWVFVMATLTAVPLLAQVPCADYFQVSSGPSGGWLGLHTDGTNHGNGQSFTLNCGARLESVAFRLWWGTDYGDVRSLAYGDTVYFSILDLDGVELARKPYMIDTGVASRTVTLYFTDDDVILLPGTYIAACWTDVPACGGMGGLASDAVAGTRYNSTNATDLTSWSSMDGEMVHTIVLDSSITPVVSASWGAVKAIYR